eukprot:Skav207442  [mRNA]  locus=scaffold1959:72953:84203:- [translate_table: standard]
MRWTRRSLERHHHGLSAGGAAAKIRDGDPRADGSRVSHRLRKPAAHAAAAGAAGHRLAGAELSDALRKGTGGVVKADLGKLATYPEQVMVINMNYRMIRSLFEAPALRDAASRLGLPDYAPPFLAAEIFDALFAPTQLLRQELHMLREELDVPRGTKFIAIHLRTGQIAYDPSRHNAKELQVFLDCARVAEQDVGMETWMGGSAGFLRLRSRWPWRWVNQGTRASLEVAVGGPCHG